MKKCIHVVNINDYFNELFKISIKTIEHFANKIGADLNIISERKFYDWPLLTEKLQVYNYGKGYDWNLLLDADILIDPDAYDPFIVFDMDTVGCKDGYYASNQLKVDDCFLRDRRNVGLSGCMIATSKLTHDLWKMPDDLTKDEILDNILQDRKIVDEYVISRNLAKYGFKYKELYPLNHYNLFFHLGMFDQDENLILQVANKWMLENFKI